MAEQFPILFNAWLAREKLTRSQAGARLGLATQMPYDYASGARLPQRRLIPDLAQRMGLPVEQVEAAVEADRAHRRATAQHSAPAARPAGTLPEDGPEPRDGAALSSGAGAAPTSDRAASASPAAPTGAGW